MQFFTIDAKKCLESNDILTAVSDKDAVYATKIAHYLVQTERWLKQYLARPHLELGRKGPVCPFVPAALNKRKALASYLLYDSHTEDADIESQLLQYGAYFRLLPESHLNTIVIVMVNKEQGDEVGASIVERVQRSLKSEFMSYDNMIGQFYSQCPVSGLHNDAFYPFDSELPMIGIRHIMPQDLVFVSDDSEHTKIYLERHNIFNKEQLMGVLASVGMAKNENVLRHVDAIYTQAT
ncbi:DUF6875 domain-containing protein [Shewanella surugensis]|uniref:DUF6875 domain-containing protein n=1 Tax=Shewanella surugensis TaxID=212020 RepID=A0ABT0LEM7_9GAMM|nr:hypothetical protein [Shewanella surugensis]MCL1125785.1 hypothetical protein [Shewanella surugensis]